MTVSQRMKKLDLYDFDNFRYISGIKKYVYITTEEERYDFTKHLIVNIEFTEIIFSPFMPVVLFKNGENRMQINGVKEVLVKDAKDSCELTFVCWYGDNTTRKKTYTFRAVKI